MRNLTENHPKPVPIVLVSGFLGAGKTTLMRRLILDAARRELRPAVIVNEFGVADVDSSILRDAAAELIAAISGGCACCSGQDDLRETLIEVAARPSSTRPGVILIEASGLADPLLVMDAVTSAELLPLVRMASLIAVADATRWDFGDELGLLLRRQVQLADVIVLNKTDICENIAPIEVTLRAINPRADLQRAVQTECDLTPVWAALDEAAPRVALDNVISNAVPHAHYHTVVCPLPHPVERARLEAALGNLGSQVWRAKGFVRVRGLSGWQLLQYTGGPGGGRWHLAPFHLPAYAEEPDGFVVFIGAALNRKQLLRDFAGTKLLAIM